MKEMIILRGIPGSGKSSYIEEGECSVSADKYFMEDGEYKFDPSKLGEAHASCFRAAVEAVKAEVEKIYIDNTNTSVAEMSPYYLLAKAFGYRVSIVAFECHPTVAWERNKHGVPLHTVTAMANRYEQIPEYWDIHMNCIYKT